jgi:spore germination cell wall hydrolase CwlJ-like protein
MIAELLCIASMATSEARGEELPGRLAVMQVLQNRAEIYDTSLCHEAQLKNQFTSKPPTKISIAEAKMFLQGELKAPDCVENATNFHSLSATPKKWKSYVFLCQVGNHRFYLNPKMKAKP